MGQSIGDQICVLAHDVNVCVVATLPKSLPSTHLLWILELFSKWAALLSKMWSCNSCSRGVQASCCVCAPQPKPIAITCFAKSFTEQTNLLFQPHVEWSWVELNWVQLSWADLNWIAPNWIGCVGWNWTELNSVEVNRVESCFFSSGVGLGWVEMTRIELHRIELN